MYVTSSALELFGRVALTPERYNATVVTAIALSVTGDSESSARKSRNNSCPMDCCIISITTIAE